MNEFHGLPCFVLFSPSVAGAVFHGGMRGSSVRPTLFAFGHIRWFRAESHADWSLSPVQPHSQDLVNLGTMHLACSHPYGLGTSDLRLNGILERKGFKFFAIHPMSKEHGFSGETSNNKLDLYNNDDIHHHYSKSITTTSSSIPHTPITSTTSTATTSSESTQSISISPLLVIISAITIIIVGVIVAFILSKKK